MRGRLSGVPVPLHYSAAICISQLSQLPALPVVIGDASANKGGSLRRSSSFGAGSQLALSSMRGNSLCLGTGSDSRQREYDRAPRDPAGMRASCRRGRDHVDAIRKLLDMQDNPQASCAAADTAARERLSEVDSRIASLKALRTELVRMIDGCSSGRVVDCRVIETLADDSHHHGRLDS